MDGLEYVRQNYDRAYPHGLGIVIRDALAGGRLDQLPPVSLLASINLPNPAGTSYFYALLTAIEPSPYVATALNAMLGAVVAAITFNLARRMFGAWAAIATGLLVATSLWASWVARGAWLQGPIEALSALAAWLTINGLAQRKPGHLFAAFVVVAFGMQTYLVAFGLLAQMMLALFVGGAMTWFRPKSLGCLRRAILAGLAVCAVSLLAYAGAVSSGRGSIPAIASTVNATDPVPPAGALNLDPLNHALRIASGRDFENTFVESDTPGFTQRDQLSDLRATVVDVLMLIGLAVFFHRSVKDVTARVVLGWFALPIAGTFLIANFLRPDWEVHVFYLLLTSPAPYLLAGAPFALMERAAQPAARNTRYVVASGLVIAGLVGGAISGWNAYGDIEATVRFPYTQDGFYSVPLKWQTQLAKTWREKGCTSLGAEVDNVWLASLLGSLSAARGGELRIRGDSTLWQVQPAGGSCALLIDGAPAPADAEVVSISIPGQKRTDGTPVVMNLYRSPRTPRVSQSPGDALAVNLGEGWRLLDLQTPDAARPGETITVTHQWQVGLPPNEPYGSWYFAPFVKLIAPEGRMVLQIDSAPALPGYLWRPGAIQISAVRFALPDDLSPGDYQLELSLFDPNQGKNAVYFDLQQPNTPIVTIRRGLSVINHDS